VRKLEYNKITSFCEELAWMVHSGINVGDSLTLLAEEEQDVTWKDCLLNMAAQAGGVNAGDLYAMNASRAQNETSIHDAIPFLLQNMNIALSSCA